MSTTETQDAIKPKGLTFEPVFHTPGVDPFREVKWQPRKAEIKDDAGTTIFEQQIDAPETWTDLSTKIASSKYFYGDIHEGTDPYTGGRESSIQQLINRVVSTITKMGVKQGYFTEPVSEIFQNELTWLCLHQHAAFNSPVWFNVGLFEEYGVGAKSGPGTYYWNQELNMVQQASNQYQWPQASACFIQRVEDTMESIMALAVSEAMLFKYGSGTGSNLSTLRSTREKLSGGGKPSGPLSFLKGYDAFAGIIKSGGKTRRAAKMNILNDNHPDIEEFIDAKSHEEKKAWALIEQGYDGSFNGEAYGSVAFQNENLSVRATDEFMQAAMDGTDWWTINVTDGKPCEKKSAQALLRKIAEGTHLCGDPGMQFETTIDKWHTCKGTGRQTATNPCSEYLFLDDTACNLASLNLLKFKTAEGGFDVVRFRAAVRILITAQEILVDSASYPTMAIAENSHIFRTLGLGFANLGALLMQLGMGYDSREGRAMAGAITAIMTGESYCQSARLAEHSGPFPGYHDARAVGFENPVKPSNADSMMEVIRMHHAAVSDIPDNVSGMVSMLRSVADNCWEQALELGSQHGYRNAQVTVLAPTGTIGFLMGCDTTGIEPSICLVAHKLLAGGGNLVLANASVKPALETLGYGPGSTSQILKHLETYETVEDVVIDGKVHKSGLRSHDLSVFDCAFKAFHGKRSLGYMGHLKMMAACQPFLSGAISKTVNLPESASVEDIMNAYTEGWKLGLKAIAIYRDGSKRSAPISNKKRTETAKLTVMDSELTERIKELESDLMKTRKEVGKPVRMRLPTNCKAIRHKFEIAGHEGYIIAGLYENGAPGEVFVQMSKEGSTVGGLVDCIGILASIALQHGVPLDSLVRKFSFQRFEPNGFTKNPDIRNATSIVDYVFRFLGCEFLEGYRESTAPRPLQDTDAPKLADKVEAPKPASIYMDVSCSNCGSSKVVRAGACGTCTECGTSAGCS